MYVGGWVYRCWAVVCTGCAVQGCAHVMRDVKRALGLMSPGAKTHTFMTQHAHLFPSSSPSSGLENCKPCHQYDIYHCLLPLHHSHPYFLLSCLGTPCTPSVCACRNFLSCYPTLQVAGELGASASEISTAKAPLSDAGIMLGDGSVPAAGSNSAPGSSGGVAHALTSSMAADLHESMANPFAAPL